jgi:cytoskeletal protein CcmA (bactofilin family)
MSFGKFRDDSSDKEKSSTTMPPTSGSHITTGRNEAFLGKGTKVVGTLAFNGPVELDGTVEGEIVAKESLTIGESAVISAKIHGSEIIIKGTVTGDIVATKRLSIKRPAKVTGNIASPTLSIEDGVQFEGKCSMNVPEGRNTENRSGLQAVGTEKGVVAAA